MQNKLRKILIEEGITHAELSRQSEVSTNTINKLCNETAHMKVKGTTKGKIIKSLNQLVDGKYTIDDVFGQQL